MQHVNRLYKIDSKKACFAKVVTKEAAKLYTKIDMFHYKTIQAYTDL